jgi:dipeptidyl aminopeptidase/acylaminoacyl peptidase
MEKESKRLIESADLYQITVLEDPRWTPSGEEFAYVQLKPNRGTNDYSRTIWRWRKDWDAPKQFTNGGKIDFHPRYSPDGERMAFLSSRGGKPQVYLIRTDGGEAQVLTSLPNGVIGFSWSPDGKQIALVSPLNADERRLEKRGKFPPPPPKDELEGNVRKVEQEHDEKMRYDPRVYRGLPFKAGTDFVSDRFMHIFLLDVDDKEAKPLRLTDGDADFSTPRWSPNGRYLWSSSVRRPTQDRYAEADIVRITVQDGEVRRMSREGHYGMGPKPSPDGNLVAAITLLDKSSYGHLPRLTVFRSNGTGWRDLNLDLDRSVGAYGFQYQYYWADDSQGLYCTIEDQGYTKIYYLSLESGEFTEVCGNQESRRLPSPGRETWHISPARQPNRRNYTSAERGTGQPASANCTMSGWRAWKWPGQKKFATRPPTGRKSRDGSSSRPILTRSKNGRWHSISTAGRMSCGARRHMRCGWNGSCTPPAGMWFSTATRAGQMDMAMPSAARSTTTGASRICTIFYRAWTPWWPRGTLMKRGWP